MAAKYDVQVKKEYQTKFQFLTADSLVKLEKLINWEDENFTTLQVYPDSFMEKKGNFFILALIAYRRDGDQH